LDLAYNMLKVIPEDFTMLKNLERVDLSNNSISSLPRGCFSSMPKLSILILSGNNFKSLPVDDLTQIPCLSTLDISYNDLEYLPKECVNLTSLRILKMSGNLFEQIPKEIAELPYHKVLKNEAPSKIISNLYLGSWEAAQNKHGLKKLGVTHVLTVAQGLQPPYPESFHYKVVEVDDHDSEDLLSHLESCIEFIQEGRQHGGILVHCAAGISRSATVTVGYLMKIQNYTFKQALEFVAKQRPIICPNPGFKKQLMQYEEELEKEKNIGCMLM